MNANLYAMRTLQKEMSGEFEKAGINSEEDIMGLVRKIRAEIQYDVVISPIVENMAEFDKYKAANAFFRNVDKEGVRISA
ncbi:Hypothetical protein DEACI_3922 [Acididesulfobacillus acetoxydans]|uniref:Uncharacterized protein n=2 Tax=Acididesulfobacillus acetoxydans TaxID=1561005 RepID=A0A8S0WA36_9FIRM|nr:Hypothetical protein DEACI_3922 [Acididesulfobacillus acetoxydans]CEJ05663.1 Hypothetical protein DEACI_0037 [Acididesulfobacillus acetoxydans]